MADGTPKSQLVEVREELERIGIDPDNPTTGLRIRRSNHAGFVKIAGSSSPAEEMEVDAGQLCAKLKGIPEGTNRDEVIRRLELPFR